MKKWFALIFFSLFILVGCATSSSYFISHPSANFLDEGWPSRVATNPRAWIPPSMRYFYDHEPLRIEQCVCTNCSEIAGIIAKPAEFNRIHLEGDFQVELIGKQRDNKIIVLGPKPMARQLIITVENHMLYLRPVKIKNKRGDEIPVSLRDLIVRISLYDLQDLTVVGNMNVYGFNIESRYLTIHSFGFNNILLFGKLAPAEIINQGSGTISIFGTYTPALSVVQNGNGTINLGGRVGIRSIVNAGNGEVNIIGAYSPELCITASGGGKTSVAGWINARSIIARDQSHVYLYCVKSHDLTISASGGADIGIAGSSENLNLNLQGNTFFGGKYLQVNNVYVKTKNNAHANVWANQKTFAVAIENSSVFAYGPPDGLSRYTSNNGWILPLQNNTIPTPPVIFTGTWNDSLNTAGRQW